jgi:hypothetical protein
MGLLFLRGDEAHGVLIKARRRLLALDIGKEAVFVTLRGKRADFFECLCTCCHGAPATYSRVQRCAAFYESGGVAQGVTTYVPANLSTMKYKPLLPPPPISPITTASEEQENNNDNQNEIHSFLRYLRRRTVPSMWVRITTPLDSESTHAVVA